MGLGKEVAVSGVVHGRVQLWLFKDHNKRRSHDLRRQFGQLYPFPHQVATQLPLAFAFREHRV